MSDMEDVEDYVHDELKQKVVKIIGMRRLLKDIKKFDRPDKQRQSVAMVHMHHACSTTLHPMFTLVLSCSHDIFLSYAPLLYARYNTQSPAMQTLLEKGLRTLSVEEVGHLLSHLGLAHFAIDLKAENVRQLFLVVSWFDNRHFYLLYLAGQWR